MLALYVFMFLEIDKVDENGRVHRKGGQKLLLLQKRAMEEDAGFEMDTEGQDEK